MKLFPSAHTILVPLIACTGLNSSNAATISINGALLSSSSSSSATTIWEGWGLSLAWLGNLFGADEDLADALFTLDTNVPLIPGQDPLPALGLNIARYNVGGTCGGQRDSLAEPIYQGVSTEACSYSGETSLFSNIRDYKRIQTFWMNWGSTDPTNSASWRWDVDLNQRTMVQYAKQRNPNMIFELFSNSPPWWMTNNKYTSGGYLFSSNNLQEWNEGDFAYYLATVARYFQDNFGIEFYSIAPFNEPRGGGLIPCWWITPDATQEGCCMGIDQQGRVIDLLRAQLDQLDLQNIIISASDESYVDRAIQTYDGLSDSTKNNIQQINVHGYQGLTSNRHILHDRAVQDGKKLWLSEYGDDDLWPSSSSESNGLRMVENIYTDFIYLQMSSWSYWQPFDETYGWGMIKFSNDGSTSWWGEDKSYWDVHYKYYVFAQFTRHIRPGMIILQSGGSFEENHFVVAYNEQDERLVIVTTRYGNGDAQMTYDLSQFASVGGPVSSWVTDTVLTRKYESEVGAAFLSGSLLQTSLNQWSIQSIEVENVKAASPTMSPTNSPTKEPTNSQTKEPSNSPTREPSGSPTTEPMSSPTKEPTGSPTKESTGSPTEEPTGSPTKGTSAPTAFNCSNYSETECTDPRCEWVKGRTKECRPVEVDPPNTPGPTRSPSPPSGGCLGRNEACSTSSDECCNDLTCTPQQKGPDKCK